MSIKLLVVLVFSIATWLKSDANTHFDNAGKIKALHLVLGSTTPSDIYTRIELASKAGFDTVVLGLRDALPSNKHVCSWCNSSWTDHDFVKLKLLSESLSISLIPEVKLLTKVKKLPLDINSSMLLNAHTYDPADDNVYRLVFDYLDEIIETLNPKAIHIGHDELAGYSNISTNHTGIGTSEALSADMFLKDILILHEYLKDKGIEVWMWGDMLIAKEEFVDMEPLYLHGDLPGYGATLRGRIPKSIVICDWHYSGKMTEFPTIDAFKNEGFKVVGVTWKHRSFIERFTQYAIRNDADGMMASTWWHVQKKEWGIVDRIIIDSGLIFNKLF